jgi:ANTAR domain-containing protein
MDDVDRTALLTRMARLIGGTAGDLPLETRLCHVYLQILGGEGAALTLAYTSPDRVTLCATDDIAARLEDLQDVLGEGPGPTAFRTEEITVADLRSEQERWPLFADAARKIPGTGLLYAVPLRPHNAEVIGVLTIHQQDPNRPDPDQSQFLANAIAAALVQEAPDESELVVGPWANRSRIHQATGMVVAQLRIRPDDALALLRAHAFSHNLSLTAVAERVTSRSLHFTDDPESETP